jgi:CRP-like cAMP-binding protein
MPPSAQSAHKQFVRYLQESRKPKRIPARDIVFSQGDPARRLYYINHGLLKLVCRVDGDRTVLNHFARPGGMIGEQVLFSNREYQASLIAMQASSVYEFSRKDFFDSCKLNPSLWHWYAEQADKRLAETERRIQLLSLYRVEDRILQALSELTEMFAPADGDSSNIPLSQRELADLIGATRETTSTALNALERRGLVRLGRKLLSVPPARSRTVAG